MENTYQNGAGLNVGHVERALCVSAGTALAVYAARRRGWAIPGWLAAGALLYRGVSGRCPAYRSLGINTNTSATPIPYETGVKVRVGITISRPRQEVYAFWRQLENLPRFMNHLTKVEQLEDGRSHWEAKGPLDQTVGWDAEIINEIPGELLAWKSVPGSDVDNAGSVHFNDSKEVEGTEVVVKLQYHPPAGAVGAWVARVFDSDPKQAVADDLERLKVLLESGAAVTEGKGVN